MIILHDTDTLLHETVELLGAKLKPALESPDRIRAIVRAVQESGKHDLKTLKASNDDQFKVMDLAKATHDTRYLNHIENVFQAWLDAGLVESHESVLPECFRLHNKAMSTLEPPKDIYARAGYYAFDMSTGITRNSWKSIVASANLAVQAARYLDNSIYSNDSQANTSQVTSTLSKSILALCRPPGHHCTGQQAGGYCYINNIALSITSLRQSRADASPLKFAILDLDFHHGNGTQEIFYEDPTVLYVSLHGQDEFPYYTGSVSERGPTDTTHPAHGTNINFPLPVGTSAADYKATLHKALDLTTDFRPDYLLVSLGFDTFHLDPLGKFEIMTEDYRDIAYMVRRRIPEIPSAIILEGGYVIDRLGENLLAFLDGWESAEREGI